VIHRNIKPQNVLLAQSGDAKVADFGIARVVSSTFVTRTGALLGTAHYISPEQALGQPATFQSDLYSLGVVLYETLAEEVPHGAETYISLDMKHVNGLLRPLREVNASIPEGLNAVVMRLLDKDPEQRYGDTDELMADLERMGQGESPVTRQEDGNSPASQESVLDHEEVGPTRTPQAPPPRGKKLVLMATAVGPLLVLLTGGGVMALTGLGPAAGLLGDRRMSLPTKARAPSRPMSRKTS
jgi:eukaryotic-like serine/threonine-protein kinase